MSLSDVESRIRASPVVVIMKQNCGYVKCIVAKRYICDKVEKRLY
jgi:hypothetical protein